MISSIFNLCTGVQSKKHFCCTTLNLKRKRRCTNGNFSKTAMWIEKHRGSLSSSSRECKTNFLEREKKKHYLSKSHLQPASLPYISLFLRGKIQAILEPVRQKRKSKLSFPNESQRWFNMLRKCWVDFCRNYRGNWKKDSRTRLRAKVISQHLSTYREIASSYMIFKTTTNLVLLNNLLPTYLLKGLFKA